MICAIKIKAKTHFGSLGFYFDELKPTSFSLLYSKISPGWQSSTLQIESNVVNLMALAFPVLRFEMFDMVMPTLSESSVTLILRFASMISKLTTIPIIIPHYTVRSFSSLIFKAVLRSSCRIPQISPTRRAANTIIRIIIAISADNSMIL